MLQRKENENGDHRLSGNGNREKRRKYKEFLLANGFELVAGSLMFHTLSDTEIEKYLLTVGRREFEEINSEEGVTSDDYAPEEAEEYVKQYAEEARWRLEEVAQKCEMTFEEAVSLVSESDRRFPTKEARKRLAGFIKRFA